MTTQPTPPAPAAVCERLRKIATCIYIAVEAPVADDVSSAIRQAIALIEQGEKERERVAELEQKAIQGRELRHDLRTNVADLVSRLSAATAEAGRAVQCRDAAMEQYHIERKRADAATERVKQLEQERVIWTNANTGISHDYRVKEAEADKWQSCLNQIEVRLAHIKRFPSAEILQLIASYKAARAQPTPESK